MRLVSTFALLLTASAAEAHVVIADRQAAAGVTHAALFRIGHGCGESPTVSLHIEIPAGLNALSAVPEQGWTLNVARQGGRITSVTWSDGYLPPKLRAGFGILLQVPEKPGTFYFPAVQTCREGINRWTEIPAQGQGIQALKFPAPSLEIVPKSTGMPENRETPPVSHAPHHHH